MAGMSSEETIWRPTGRFADVLSIGQALWGWAAFWTLVAAVMAWAASTIAPVWSLGWGAVAFAGAAAASGITIAIAFVLIAWRYLKSPVRGDRASGRVPTSCKIAFAPDGQSTSVAVQNIKRWFVLRNMFFGFDKETNITETHVLTNLFVTFEEPVGIKQVHVRGQGAPVPPWEMKDRDPWQIVLAFNGPLAGILLEVEVEV